MELTKRSFGNLSDGREATLYTLKNSRGAAVSLTNYGAAVVSILTPDQNGTLTDIVLGCDCAADYETQTACVGAVPGRHANRIRRGVFTLNGTEYQLNCNAGINHLHGGLIGFDKKLWNHAVVDGKVVFSLFSPDGEEHYPGNLMVSVSYSFDEENRLTIEYNALSDQDTVVNLTNHAYFNLSGHDSGDILDQMLKINADRFTQNDEECIPNGTLLPVDGPLDFRQFKPIGRDIEQEDFNLKVGSGYDHNYVINRTDETSLADCAQAYSPATGITLSCRTTQPGVQLYTANFIHEGKVNGKNGAQYGKRSAFCLETQHFPDAVHHPDFPSVIVKAGELYHQVTEYQFGLKANA